MEKIGDIEVRQLMNGFYIIVEAVALHNKKLLFIEWPEKFNTKCSAEKHMQIFAKDKTINNGEK